ncbi:MAG: S24/S26 family peptidase [Planctomycetota bacterium]
MDPTRLLRAGMEVVLDEGVRVPVSGDCMDPAVPEGAQVRVERCRPSCLRPGDVVLLQRGGRFVLHRYLAAIRVGARARILTRSDRKRRPDAPWPTDSLVGRLAEIAPGCGKADTRDGTGRPYRPSRRERLAAALWGLFWGSIAPFLRDARDTLGLRRR